MIDRASPPFELRSGGEPAAALPHRGRIVTSIIVGLLCCLVYAANFRAISAGDTYPARYLPFAIWRSHTVLLDPIAGVVTQGWTPITPFRAKGEVKSVNPEEAFWAVRLQDGHVVSLYPVVVPLLVAPLYLPAVAYLHATGWEQLRLEHVARIMEKISASLLAAGSAALLYLLLRRRLQRGPSLLLTFAYAFGTTTWVISSQALWQHGAGELLVVCALLLLTGVCARWRAVAAGIVLGLIACNRPPDVLIAAALGIYALSWARGFRLLLIAGGLLPCVPLLSYNLGVVGHIAGAYGVVGESDFFRHDLLSGIAGLLFSPTKGLFFFSPFLIFVPFCVPRLLRDARTRGLGIAALCAVILQLLVYSAADWRQGGSWGPRWLTDLLPLLIWMLTPLFDAFGRPARALFVLGVAAAMVIETIGAFWYTGTSDVAIYASAAEINPMRSAWELRNAPFIAELKHAPAPFDLATEVRGYLDVVKPGYGPAGREINVQGWALADDRSPAEVVVLVDGHVAASASQFGLRADVARALGVDSPSGWSVTIPASHLSGGNHVIAALARAYAGGGVQLLGTRSVDFPAGSGLAFSARLAADILTSHQQQPGYWLTYHTVQTRFEHAQPEMNTYLPSIMLDFMAPIAESAGLHGAMDQARHFLAEQIEANGLVRYHGLPNAPTIGTLGCAITPDADDTALVWRLAPAATTERRTDALRTMAGFKTNGLYRTWLAPKDRYECIDPGSDPDPVDIGIQMNVLLFLATAEPQAAKDLCAAIQRSADDDRVWVYYRRAPLLPLLRQADLREAGCPLRLPASRVDSAVPGQELWTSAARLLDRLRENERSPDETSEIRSWLEKVAADDFALVRSSPPLLYHNDLTASVSRYYWSEDFGYVLWLRLYFELARRSTS